MMRSRVDHRKLPTKRQQNCEANLLRLSMKSMTMAVPSLRAYGHDASMRYLALLVLELNRRMVDVKRKMQLLFDVTQDALADGRRNVGNRNVTRQSVCF